MYRVLANSYMLSSSFSSRSKFSSFFSGAKGLILLQVSAEVQQALKNNQPVVALESTIISHGMPFPQNAQTAIEVEETIRKQGAVPATIAIIGGVITSTLLTLIVVPVIYTYLDDAKQLFFGLWRK